MTRKEDSGKTFLGFDLSTQKLKAVLLSEDLKIIAISEVKYDTDLPEYRTTGGALSGPHENEYTACPVMWIKAIDIVLDRLIMQGVDLSTVSCISASAQQHGSVFWSHRGVETLKSLDSNQFLHVQLDDSAFALTRSPIWMDSSAESQCIEMETAIGGRKEMVDITGSKCYPRFTGPQIRKVYQKRANVYQNCERISLISSFVASVFLGDVAAIDYSDASGMNLFDIKQKTWSKTCLNACAPDLEQRLGAAVPSNTIIGNVSAYFQERFGFSDDCKVSASTGDNSSALAGMVVDSNYLVISLGTSDTILMNMEHQTLLEEGHVLCHPIDTNLFMGLLCFRNGSLVRDAINKVEANGNWTVFNEHLESTPRGNFGNMAIHFHDTEIIPNARGILRWSKEHNIGSSDASRGVQKFSSPQIEIRALIEGQMLHHKAVAEDMGFFVGENTKIIATGGASINQSILQVVSDVFNAPVYTQEKSESALLGAAYRAKYSRYLHDFNGDFGSAMKYHDYINQHLGNRLTEKCKPSKDCEQIYRPMLQRYRDMVTLLKIKDNE